MSLLIRFARKRLSAWCPERSDPDVKKLEFTDKNGVTDLRPSVFEIDLKDLIHACAEYSTLRNLPESTFGVDVADLGRNLDAPPGATGFKFTTEVHREVVLRNEQDLLAFIHELRRDLERRKYCVTKNQVVEYAKSRLIHSDAEWLAAVGRARLSGAKTWVSNLPNMTSREQ